MTVDGEYCSSGSSHSHSRPSLGTSRENVNTLSLAGSFSKTCSVSSETPASALSKPFVLSKLLQKLWALSKRQTAVLVTTNIANFLAFACLSILNPIFPKEALNKGVSDTWSGLVFGISSYTQFFVSPILGMLAPTIGVKLMFISGIALFGVCTLLFGFLSYVPVENGNGVFIALCFILQVIKSVGIAGASTASFVMSVQEFPDNKALVFGFNEIAVGIGLVVGPLIAGALYELDGFYLPFVTIGGLSILSTIMGVAVPAQKAFADTGKQRISTWKIFKSPMGIMTSMAIVCSTYMWSILDPTLEPFLRKFDLTPVTVGLLFLVMAAAYALTAPLWGWVADKLDDQRILIAVGFVFACLACLLIGPSSLIGFDENFSELWLIVFALVLLGVAESLAVIPTFDMYFTIAKTVGCEDDTKAYSVIAGVWNAMYNLGDGLGSSIGGALLDNVGFRDMCTYTAGICLFMFFVFFLSWIRRICKKNRNTMQVSYEDNRAYLANSIVLRY